MRVWFRRLSLAVVAAAALMFAAGSVGIAQDDTAPGAQFVSPDKKKKTGLQLQETLLEHFTCSGASCPVLTINGYTPLDTEITIKCSAACTFLATGSVQVGNNISASRPWGICTWIDGKVTEFGCPFIGYMPTDRSVVSGALSQSLVLTSGKHTVQTFVYSTTLGQLSTWNLSYQIFQ